MLVTVTATPTHLLIDARLEGTDLETLVRRARDRTPPVSWRDLAKMVKARTGISVGHESLRQWFAEEAA